MTDNEKLVEKAAKAIMEASHGEGVWELREPMEEDLYMRRARAALAVFEKAHTPTNDIASTLATALVHTVEYVGNDVLPVLEGWSWYDALFAYDETLIAEWKPAHPVASTDDEREALATALDDVHDECVTEGGCDFRGWITPWRPGETPRVNGAAVDPILAALRRRSDGEGEPSDEYDEEWPQAHTRVVAETWPLDCVEGGCSHCGDDTDGLDACPSTVTALCDECSAVTAEYEGPALTWPCENAAVQHWQRQGGPERNRSSMVEAFLRGWREHSAQGEVAAWARAHGFRDGVDYIDDHDGPWGAAVVAGRAEAARRVAEVTGRIEVA